MPGLGQSGISRMSFFNSSIRVAPPERSVGPVVLDREPARIARLHLHRFFGDVGDARATRAARELLAQCAKLLGGADGVNLDAAVTQVLHVPRDAKSLGDALGEKTIAYALHHPGGNEPPGLKYLGHSRAAILPEPLWAGMGNPAACLHPRHRLSQVRYTGLPAGQEAGSLETASKRE